MKRVRRTKVFQDSNAHGNDGSLLEFYKDGLTMQAAIQSARELKDVERRHREFWAMVAEETKQVTWGLRIQWGA